MPRDEFKKPTLDALAKRVGFNCSNPNCEKPTIGPNSQLDGVLLIGVGAHITAAAAGGPRFDPKLSPADRSSISNGIWLCTNCATMIDKDSTGFPVELLQNWKTAAETKARQRMQGDQTQAITRPYLEADLIWDGAWREPRGLSDKNPFTIQNGIIVYEAGSKPIKFWALNWNYKLVIYNNSSVPVFNVAINSIGAIHFNEITCLERKNNLAALANIDLQTRYEYQFEGDYLQAEAILNQKPPKELNNLKLEILYHNERRQNFKTLVQFIDGEINNYFL